MHIKVNILVKQFSILFSIIHCVVSLQDNPYHHEFLLDSESSYTVQWTVDWSTREIIFNITAATTGYIGFGLSSGQTMLGADLILGGVRRSGEPYLQDMHGVPEELRLVEDVSQDYKLISAWENKTHTSIRFSRAIDTCDENDHEINDDALVILWAVGELDDTNLYHFQKRGTFNAYLLDPDFTPRDILNAAENERRLPTQEELGDLKIWTVSRAQRIPTNDTVYWCSIHKGPQLETRHHIVGHNFRWETQEQFDHTHHLLLYRCTVPPGENAEEIFEPYIRNNTGERCFFLAREQSGSLPAQYCREVLYDYAIGGRIDFLPEHAGFSIGSSKNEYFLLQVHYDNPGRRDDLNYTINIDMYYTPNLRPLEAGLMTVGHQIPGSPSLLLPPASTEHMIYGHCGGMCTNEMIPPQGIRVFGVRQHTHNSGYRIRLRHFRGRTEIPWIINDDNYNNRFQNLRMLRNERRVLSGDHLMVQCTYDNTWTNGTATGGFSTRQEMCVVYIMYYGKVNYSICRSEIVDDEYRRRWLGVRNLTWSDDHLQYVAGQGEPEQGQTVTQLSDAREWGIVERENLQRDHKEMMQINTCNREDGANSDRIKVAAYPVGIQEWKKPERQCNYGI